MKSIVSFLSVGVGLLSVLTLLPQPIIAKKDAPTIKSTSFDNALEEVFYFDDSNVIVGLDRDTQTAFRSDNAGETWDKIDDEGQAGKITLVWPHPSDKDRAYMLGNDEKHWMTKDQGKTWKTFDSKSSPAFYSRETLRFHGRDPKKVIWNGLVCDPLCSYAVFYTENDFDSIHSLGKGRKTCQWAVSTPLFGAEIDSEVKDRIFCISQGQYSSKSKDYRLTVSDDYFKRQEIEPLLDSGRAVPGIISMAAVKKYFVAAAKSEGTDELALYVTDDSSEWHRAEFGQHKVAEDAYTVLESTNYSMQIDVLGSKPWNPMGHLFTSNSNGTFFVKNLDYTNRNAYGRVDFEKVQNIQGIVLVNTVDNHKEVADSPTRQDIKKVVSQISFDDARTFEELKVGRERLHLHSVTNAQQDGRVFSSLAPGIVMGVGNTGKYLRKFEECDLYVSDDAGRTWRKALDGPYFYEFGNNGAILVAVDAKLPTKQLQYSLNHGIDWSKVDLDETVTAQFLTTVPDSTTRTFIMMGKVGSGTKTKYQMFKIDFDGLHERTCGNKDFETWQARLDDDGKPTCIMGQQQSFKRRKANADCFIDADFKDPEPETKVCACTVEDFECDFDFVRDANDRKKCNPATPLKVPEGECKKETDTFKGASGWRLIPGNKCEGGEQLDKEIERPCKDTLKKPISDQVEVERTDFRANDFRDRYYLEGGSTSSGEVETVIMQDSSRNIWISHDHGQKWEQILKGESVLGIVPNPYFHERVFFLTGSETVHYSIDRGYKFQTLEARKPPSTSRGLPLKFHPSNKEWLLWSGRDGDDGTTVYFSDDRGGEWKTLVRSAEKCEYLLRNEDDTMIFCDQHENEDIKGNLQLVSSDDFFAKTNTHFKNIKDFATMSEFVVVATMSEDQKGLRVDTSNDGVQFAEAKFPKNFYVKIQQAYTVLDSSTHAVFLHVTVNAEPDQQYGSILKSNSNGTSYVLSINAVNRDGTGYVDFEKMQGLEGVSMVNIVSNTKEVDDGAAKKLKSMITHNDGAEWALIPPPKQDASGRDYACVGTAGEATEKCALHLHSYTERDDKSATFSSSSAVGLMLAVGNVGEFLEDKAGDSTDTFITRDAGITWSSVKKGPYMWEYGDQGSIIVIVPEGAPTRSVFYTLDEGKTWIEYEFSTKAEMFISAISTVPSDNSLKFLLWGKESGARGTISTISLDFTQLSQRQRQCKLDDNNPTDGDYMLWQPQHPKQPDGCLFGHIAQYHRKKIDADCYNGKQVDRLPHSIVKNCTCSRSNYECDYNYQTKSDGTCELVEGLTAPDHLQFCKDNPDQTEYYKTTGYRKIPLDTCEGGQEFDKIEVLPCPGHEEEFKRKHGLGGAALFFAIVIPVIAACGVGYWVWQRYQKYGFGNFGEIRLGESMGARTPGSRGQSALIAIPVAIIAGTWAVAKAIPLLAASLFRSAKGYVPVGSRAGYSQGPYRSRDAFSNRRQDYSSAAFVEDDELLGDDDELDGDDV